MDTITAIFPLILQLKCLVHDMNIPPHTLASSFESLAQSASSALIASIWQGALLALSLVLLLRLSSRASGATRFAVWAAGFAAIAAMPLLPSFAHFISGNAGTHASLPAALESAPHAWLQFNPRWSIAIALLWTAASLYRLADLGLHSLRLRRLWKTATPSETTSLPTAAFQLPGRKPIELCTTRELDRPGVIGFFAPRILVPEWLLNQITPAELNQIVLHEMEHLRRGDDWTNLLQKIVLAAFPLNPVLFWIEHRLCLEREIACDDAVVAATRAPRAYAACLTSLAEHGLNRRTEALSLGLWQRRPELTRRVHSVLRRTPALGTWGARGLVATMGCGLILSSVELSRCPQLIGFAAPESPITATAPANRGQKPVQMPARMIDTAFDPASAYRKHNAPRPYLTELKATIPARPATKAVPAISTSAKSKKPAPHETMLKAELPTAPMAVPGANLIPANPAHENQAQAIPVRAVETREWIVVATTWEGQNIAASSSTIITDAPTPEETQKTATQPSQTASAASADANAPAVPSSNKPAAQMPLVLRTLPNASLPPGQFVLPVRGGWLVIQL